MKRVLALIACLLLEGCVHAAATDLNPAKSAVPGGWSATALDDARVKIAAQRAVESKAASDGAVLTLNSIEAAQRQVVAGMNYKLRLSVSKGGQPQFANATVWAKLNGTYELTAWSWE